jgi:hypothetical protein
MAPPAGRNPIGEKAMTPAEKQRRYREKQKQDPNHKTAYFLLTGDPVDEIDRIAKIFDMPSRAHVLRALATRGLHDCIKVMRKTGADKPLPKDPAQRSKSLALRRDIWNDMFSFDYDDKEPTE